MIYPIVMAGQSEPDGTPGPELLPAHFHSEAMIESRFQSVLRGLIHPMFAAPTVISCEAHRFVAAQQMQSLGVPGEVLVEPGQCNSAAALAAVALRFQHDPEALLLIVPGDILGADGDPFRNALEAALPSAFAGNLVLLAQANSIGGTRYGQVQPLCRARFGEPVQALFSSDVPDGATPGSLWNSGVYLVRAGSLLAAFKRYAPRLLQSTKRAVAEIRECDGFLRLAPAAYDRLRREDFETAILSRMEMVLALPCDHAQMDPLAAWREDAHADRSATAARNRDHQLARGSSMAA